MHAVRESSLERGRFTERMPSPPTKEPLGSLRGLAAGLFLIVIVLTAMAAACAVGGWIPVDTSGRIDLSRWLMVELVAGAVVCPLAGALARRISGVDAARRLAVVVGTTAVLETAELIYLVQTGVIIAPVVWISLAPLVAFAGVWLGGCTDSAFLSGKRNARPVFSRMRSRVAIPVGAFVVTLILATFATPSFSDERDQTILANALAIDFTASIPALFYFLLVRARRAPVVMVLPVMVVGFACAWATLAPYQPIALSGVRWLAVPVELALLFVVVNKARTIWRDQDRRHSDFSRRLRAASRQSLAARIPADILTTEVSVLYYAFRRRSGNGCSSASFTSHRAAHYGSLLIALGLVLGLETAIAHYLLAGWSVTAAWVMTGLSLYALVWMIGDYRALVSRCIVVTPTHLDLCLGIRWDAMIPLSSIAEVRQIGRHETEFRQNALVATVLAQPTVLVTLREPVEAIGMYGIRRGVRDIHLSPDEPEQFIRVIHDALSNRRATA